MDWFSSSPLFFFHIHIKLSFASPLSRRKSADLLPDRVGEERDARTAGGGFREQGVWEKFTASAAHVEMMSSRKDRSKASNGSTRFDL